MIRLLKFGAALPKLRYCGNLLVKAECISKIPTATRSFMTKTSETMESRFRARDMVPESFHIVYRGGMDYYVHLAHHSSILFAFLGIGTAYRTFYIEDEPVQFPVDPGFALIGVQNYTQVFIMYATSFMLLYGMRQISSKYVLRMYYNPTTETYRAIKVGFLPMATRSYDFQAGTLLRQTKRHLRPWMNGVHKTNDTKIMFFEGGFKTSADYNRMFID